MHISLLVVIVTILLSKLTFFGTGSRDILEQGAGSRDGPVVRVLASHQCVPGSIPGPGVICGLSLLLVLFLAPRGFSPGTPVFPSPQKPTFPNSSSIWNCQALYHEPLAWVIAQALPVFDIKFALFLFSKHILQSIIKYLFKGYSTNQNIIF